MDNPTLLLWGVLFSSIGLGYFIYGKKQHKPMVLLSGIGLMIYPYFIANAYLVVLIGVVLILLPRFIDI